jgi:hypothetical protein
VVIALLFVIQHCALDVRRASLVCSSDLMKSMAGHRQVSAPLGVSPHVSDRGGVMGQHLPHLSSIAALAPVPCGTTFSPQVGVPFIAPSAAAARR